MSGTDLGAAGLCNVAYMEERIVMNTSRRFLLSAFLAAPFVPLTGTRGFSQTPPSLPPTRACDAHEGATRETDAGPFFRPNAPLKHDLFPDSPGGERITVAGVVVDGACNPLPQTLLEIWHADENGAYDQAGYRLRGHQFADERGRWWFNTIVPALYPGRTRHFHFKVQRPGGSVLTTQLFFPGEPRNARDYLFDKSLLMDVSNTRDGKFARFDFVV